MRIKEYLKDVWKRLKYDESGQWATGVLSRALTTPQTNYLERYKKMTPEKFADTEAGKLEQLARQLTSVGGGGAPSTPAQAYYGGGGFEFPQYKAPAISLNVPSFAWSPTAQQRGGWEEESARKTAMIYEPQKEELARQLERYRGTVEEERGRIAPMYGKQSRAVANIIENTVKQALIEDAIRRGAETGGELPRQVAGAGRLEVQQRREIETERAQQEATLSRALLEHERQTGEQITSLQQLQGLHGEQIRAELEREARDWAFRETGSKFEAELAVASLKNAIAAAEYQAQYQQAVFKAQQQQQTWERGFSEQQLALQTRQASFSQAMAARGDPLAALKEEIMRAEEARAAADEERRQELHDYYIGMMPGEETTPQPTWGGATRNIEGTNYLVNQYGQPIAPNIQELWATTPGTELITGTQGQGTQEQWQYLRDILGWQ